MKFTVQTDELNTLKEALASGCDEVRFGPEFCEWKIPNLAVLKEAYELTSNKGKPFAYVTPRVSIGGIKKIREHIDFLSGKGNVNVVINDLGVLNIIRNHPELKLHLGRQLIYIPGRGPWLEWKTGDVVRVLPYALSLKLKMGSAREMFSQTSLNYGPTADFYLKYGVKSVDVDWTPRCFSHYGLLVKKGFNLAVHTHLVPATLTRKCHTARFLNERSPENCSKPCNMRAFLLKTLIDSELFLHGNVVFSFVQPSKEDLKKLIDNNITEFVITMNPVTKILNRKKIDELTSQMKNML